MAQIPYRDGAGTGRTPLIVFLLGVAGACVCCGSTEEDSDATLCDSACSAAVSRGCPNDDLATCVATCSQHVEDAGCAAAYQELLECTAALPADGLECNSDGEAILAAGACVPETAGVMTACSSEPPAGGDADGGGLDAASLPGDRLWVCLDVTMPEGPACTCIVTTNPDDANRGAPTCTQGFTCCLVMGSDEPLSCTCRNLADGECQAQQESGLWSSVLACPPS